MAIFGRRKNDTGADVPPDQAVVAFWEWWNREGAHQWAQVAGQGIPDGEVLDGLRSRVEAMGDGLMWETAAGSESVHQLIVTAEGNPELRATARRWLLAAPETDPIWSYGDSRPARGAIEDIGVVLGDLNIDGAQAQVGVRRSGSRVDVTLYHPGLAEVSADDRALTLFVLLDQTLGEKQTETWIGELTPSEVPPLDGFGLSGLRAVVRDLAAEFTSPDGEPLWAQFSGESPLGPVTAAAQIPLAAAQWPLLDRYARVEAQYSDQEPNGLPNAKGQATLERLQGDLDEAVGEQGRVVGHETTGGLRALHVYVDSRSGALAAVREVAKRWDGKARVTDEYDPGWSAVQHLRG
ncbi:DUF695 domain-containing protein [Demetria terragena]|uniref:DUF695 domain-containing protein n=1 Tax=Demetria terragena TaxID=63959 RepID=UPI00036F5475|nr:DUF695 domain-containing protein [Demetria terragena]